MAKDKAPAAYRICVLVDGSANADAAFDAALQIKKNEHFLLVVHSVNLIRPWIGGPHAGPYLDPQTLHKTNDGIIHNAKHMVAKYTRMARQMKIPNVQAFVVTSDESPKDAALHFAKEQDCKLIVVGSRGIGGLQRLLMGSFSQHIVQNAFCDVLVARTAGHRSIKEMPGLLGTATRSELSQITMSAQQPMQQPRQQQSPSQVQPRQSKAGDESATSQSQAQVRHKVLEKQKELTELMEELSLLERQREEEFQSVQLETREYAKRKDAEVAQVIADSARKDEAWNKAMYDKEVLRARIQLKEEEARYMQNEKKELHRKLEDKQREAEQRSAEKEDALAESRRRQEDFEKQRSQLAAMLKRTEEIGARDRAKLERERAKLEDLANSRAQESEHERALRVQQVKEKDAELANVAVRDEQNRKEMEKEIRRRDEAIQSEKAKEKRLEGEVEAERRHERELEKQLNESHVELERQHKTHTESLEKLRREMSEKEVKWQSDRNEYRSQLAAEKEKLLRALQQRELDLETERAKRKEAEMLRAKDAEARIGEKASASRMLREEAHRTETEAIRQLQAQHSFAKQKAEEMREAESRAAATAQALGQQPHGTTEGEVTIDSQTHSFRSTASTSDTVHTQTGEHDPEKKACVIA